jgi:hypothetical protein
MVREGETILVTDRDEVIAEIHRPTQPFQGKLSRWEAAGDAKTIPAHGNPGPHGFQQGRLMVRYFDSSIMLAGMVEQ